MIIERNIYHKKVTRERLESVEDGKAIFGRKLRFLRHLSLTREGFVQMQPSSSYFINFFNAAVIMSSSDRVESSVLRTAVASALV